MAQTQTHTSAPPGIAPTDLGIKAARGLRRSGLRHGTAMPFENPDFGAN